MTWSKFDDAAAKNPKSREVGNEAWALWAAAVMYCNRHLTDGLISLAALADDCLPRSISETKAKKLAEQLCDCATREDGFGLFERAGKEKYRVHDFLEWNPSKSDVESRRKLDRDRKRGKKESDAESNGTPRGIPDGFQPDSEVESARLPEPTRASAGALPVPSRPVPSREEEDPPTPNPEDSPGARSETRIKTRDRFADSFAGFQVQPEVAELHEAFRQAFLPEHEFRLGSDEPAILAESIRLHGLANCLLVVNNAHSDGMVNGTRDDKGNKHESIGYIFGNPSAFARILRDTKKKSAENSESVGEMIARRKAVQAGTP